MNPEMIILMDPGCKQTAPNYFSCINHAYVVCSQAFMDTVNIFSIRIKNYC